MVDGITPLNQDPEDFQSGSSRGRIRETGIFVGIVKNTEDVQRMGRLQVFIPELGGDPNDPSAWFTMSYASPFAGATPVDDNNEGGKQMSDSQRAYGFWMVPPDVENQVLCCFANGDTARGYWFACLYQQFMNHMVPGIAINYSTDDEINAKNLPPVVEYNKKDDSLDVWDPKRPVFTPLHEGLTKQGLYTDPERGGGTSSARRESPSQVFGFSSPRGNNIHIDENVDNEFIRLRTRSGVQILIHETTGYIYMISKEGNSWMEISDEGIDMYSKRSISMRAEENINIHADGSVINSGGATHSSAGNYTSHSEGRRTETQSGPHQNNGPLIKENSTPDYQPGAVPRGDN